MTALLTMKPQYDVHGIKPVIDIRNPWKDGEETELLNPEIIDNVLYDYRGTVLLSLSFQQ